MFVGLTREYHWTPDQIRRLTLDELEIYAKSNQAYRDIIKPLEVTTDQIRRALFAWLKIKEPPTRAETEKQIDKVVQVKVSTKQFDDFIAAGMPSPAMVWFKQWEKDNG